MNSHEICLGFLSTLDEFEITSSDSGDINFIDEDSLNWYWEVRETNEQIQQHT